ncbi:hypothetical protein CSC94_22175 [Zhengella mangrovi]|uniref:DUF2924 domain-containing protein n=1 Tax=Zhengella mangrovi TaxID=1982044 RepID=A0A2G1QH95_9HYPH|nr:DUF2924 domain-containing protein [Zhengella mangrovi]PHP64893.1 hypothetical protein CSC94_22175 [Zhengella mangrovi]
MARSDRIEKEVAGISRLQRDELVALWITAHGHPPPKGVKRGLLERSAAWHLQSRRLGGHSKPMRRFLRQGIASLATTDAAVLKDTDSGLSGSAKPAASDPVTRPAPPPALPALASGTRLVRTWNGRPHVVDVVEDGFVFDGKTYRSLSAIARRITGTRWSGPRFFGIAGR